MYCIWCYEIIIMLYVRDDDAGEHGRGGGGGLSRRGLLSCVGVHHLPQGVIALSVTSRGLSCCLPVPSRVLKPDSLSPANLLPRRARERDWRLPPCPLPPPPTLQPGSDPRLQNGRSLSASCRGYLSQDGALPPFFFFCCKMPAVCHLPP